MHTCKVDNQGRLTLPAEWRKKERVEAGSDVVVTVDERGLRVQTARQSLHEAQEIIARRRRPGAESPVEMLFAERRREAGREERRAPRR